MQFHKGHMPQLRGKVKLSLEQIDEVMRQVSEWKHLQSSLVNTAGPGVKKKNLTEWDYSQPSIWVSAKKGFDISLPIPFFISFEVHVWIC